MEISNESDLVQRAFDVFHDPNNSEPEVLELLTQLSNPADIRDNDERKLTLLHHACQNEWCKVVKELIERYNCNPNCRDKAGYTPLHSASEIGNLEIIKYLIEMHHCDPESKADNDDTPLHLASQKGWLNVVRYLVEEENCNPAITNESGKTPLHKICEKGSHRRGQVPH